MKKDKLLIFDIDGTLIDSTNAYHEIVISAMKDLGFKKIDTNFNELKHHTDSYALKFNYNLNFNKEFDISLLDDFENALVKYLKIKEPSKEISGARNVILDLLKSNYAIVFATGSLPMAAMLKMNQANIWIDEKLLSTSKTSFTREGFVLEAIEKAKTYYNVGSFDEIISIGDGVWDLKTAKNLNLKFIGIGEKNKSKMTELGMKSWFKDFNSFSI